MPDNLAEPIVRKGSFCSCKHKSRSDLQPQAKIYNSSRQIVWHDCQKS